MKTGEEEFYQGFAVAVGTLIETFDCYTMAVDIMFANDISLKKLEDNGVDEVDLNLIKKAFNAAAVVWWGHR